MGLSISKSVQIFCVAFLVNSLSACSTFEDVLGDPIGTKATRERMHAEDAYLEAKKKAEKDKKNADYRARRQQWVGKSIDDLILAKGNAWGVHKRQDGGAQYTFKSRSIDRFGNASSICEEHFVTDKKGIVKTWSANGCYY